LGRYDEARVEINRALERQRAAVQANAAHIAAAQSAAAQASTQARQEQENGTAGTEGSSYDVQRAQDDPEFQSHLNQAYGNLDNLHFYAPYVNPFSVFLEGVYFLARGESLADYERARVALGRVRDMTGANDYIKADYAAAAKLAAGGGELPPTTYVVFETGMAPIREEIKIDIPLFIVSRSVPYVGIAFPQLRYNNQYNPGLTVTASNTGPLHTTMLCDMDLVIGQDFKNELPSIIIKTLISAGAKAAAQYGLYLATKNSGTLSILTEVAGVVYQYATNRADLRTWVTLPKQFLYCRLPTPPDGRLQITSDSTGETQTVDLPPGAVTMVYVKSNSYGNVLLVHAFTLR
jgi:hypothetical protein